VNTVTWWSLIRELWPTNTIYHPARLLFFRWVVYFMVCEGTSTHTRTHTHAGAWWITQKLKLNTDHAFFTCLVFLLDGCDLASDFWREGERERRYIHTYLDVCLWLSCICFFSRSTLASFIIPVCCFCCMVASLPCSLAHQSFAGPAAAVLPWCVIHSCNCVAVVYCMHVYASYGW
jgi:hypothetical protein